MFDIYHYKIPFFMKSIVYLIDIWNIFANENQCKIEKKFTQYS